MIGIALNLLLAVLLCAGLAMGWRLNLRLKALRSGHDGFAIAVRDLNAAAERAERGLADLRAATDLTVDELADRIEKGRALAARLERLTLSAQAGAPAASEADDRGPDRRLGALLAAAREARPAVERPLRREPLRARPRVEDDLFEEPDTDPLTLIRGGRR